MEFNNLNKETQNKLMSIDLLKAYKTAVYNDKKKKDDKLQIKVDKLVKKHFNKDVQAIISSIILGYDLVRLSIIKDCFFEENTKANKIYVGNLQQYLNDTIVTFNFKINDELYLYGNDYYVEWEIKEEYK